MPPPPCSASRLFFASTAAWSGGSMFKPGIAPAAPKGPPEPLRISNGGIGELGRRRAPVSGSWAGVPIVAGVPIAVVLSPKRLPMSSSLTPQVSG
ncbi:hypothetical protein ACKVV1_011523 [Pyricularia oryzae]